MDTDWLRTEFDNRRRQNPSYSLRAFARHIGIKSSRLSEYFSGRRRITHAMAMRIAEELNYSPERKRQLFETEAKDQHGPVDHLPEDVFRKVSEWYYYAILNLLRLRRFRATLGSIAKAIQLSNYDVRTALQALERLGLAKKEGSEWHRLGKKTATTHDIPSSAIRLFHIKQLHLAEDKLATVPVEQRDFSGTTFPIKSSDLPMLKRDLMIMRRKIARKYESNDGDQVYQLNIQMFPLLKDGEIT